MDADARRILELLGSAVERAEQVGVQQNVLLQRQEESTEAFSLQIAEATRAAEDERVRLLEAEHRLAALREAEVARGREEADAIVNAARAEEAAARARIAELRQAQVQTEAEHAARMAEAERERAEADAAYLGRLQQREAELATKTAEMERERAEQAF